MCAGAAIEPPALEEVFVEQKAKCSKVTLADDSTIIPTASFSKQVWNTLSNDEERNRWLRLQSYAAS